MTDADLAAQRLHFIRKFELGRYPEVKDVIFEAMVDDINWLGNAEWAGQRLSAFEDFHRELGRALKVLRERYPVEDAA